MRLTSNDKAGLNLGSIYTQDFIISEIFKKKLFQLFVVQLLKKYNNNLKKKTFGKYLIKIGFGKYYNFVFPF